MDSDNTFGGASYGPTPGGSTVSATVDGHGTVLAWSAGAQWLFGYSPEEAVGRPVVEVFGLGASAPVDFARYPAAWTREVSVHDRDGAPLRLRLYAQPLFGGQGSLQWHLTVTRPNLSVESLPAVDDADLPLLREWALAQSPLPVTLLDHKGRIAEMGTPWELWEKGGIFRGMCERGGIREVDIKRAAGLEVTEEDV